MRTEDPSVARLREKWDDAWRIAHPGVPQPPTFGLFDSKFASEPYCCDFVLVSNDLTPRIESVRVDIETQASDHQPVMVEFR